MHFENIELVPGERFFIADLPSGPFFLEPQQHSLLHSFASGNLLPHIPKLIGLVGPVKSGKSAIMNDVLPGMLAAQHAIAGGPRPVILSITFAANVSPATAAVQLLESAKDLAKTLGFHLSIPSSPSVALLRIGEVMRAFSREIESRGGMLCLLLDESQARKLCEVKKTH